jgi:hypothetical protein
VIVYCVIHMEKYCRDCVLCDPHGGEDFNATGLARGSLDATPPSDTKYYFMPRDDVLSFVLPSS